MKKKIIVVFSIILFTIIIGSGVYGAFRVTSIIVGNTSSGKIGNANIELKYVTDRTNDVYTNINDDTVGYDNGTLACYASEKRASDTRGYIELCDLAVDISISSNIDTRFRVKIQNAWNSYKIYNSGTEKSQSIEKVNDAFTFSSDDWFYDTENNYAYFNGVLPAGTDVTESMLIYNDYHYEVMSNSSYRETIYVSLQFQVDIVQANRAEEVWNVNFSEIF